MTFYYDLGSLAPHTTYYFRAKAVGNGGHGTSYGDEKSFTTLSTPPSVTTDNATSVSFFSARLKGNLTDLGTASSANVSFLWGTNPGNLTAETTAQILSANVTFYYDLGGLSDNTTYYFRAKAVGHGTSYGDEENFTTLLTTPPAVTTDNATSVSPFSARLNGTLTSLGTTSSANVSFLWGINPGNLTSETPVQTLSANVTFYYDLGSLSDNTTYYFRAKAVGHGTSYGDEESFTTLVPVPPSVTTDNATNIGSFSARLNGTLTSLGTASSANVSFRWGTSSGNLTSETPVQTLSANVTFYSNLTGLSANTVYYFRAKAVGHGTSYGDEKSFTTLTAPGGGGGGGGGGGAAGYTVTLSGFIPSTPLRLDSSGALLEAAQIKSDNGKLILDIAKGTKFLDAAGNILKTLSCIDVQSPPPAPSQGVIILACELSPNGANFEPPITLTMPFDPQALPSGVNARDLYIAFWDGNEWKTVASTVDTQASTVKAEVGHLSHFALIGKLPPPPPPPAPAKFTVSDLVVTPGTCKPDEEVTIAATVSNTGGSSGQYEVVLTINGVKEATKSVTLSPGTSLPVKFTVSKSTTDTYKVDVNGVTASFVVEKPAPTPTTAPVLTPTPASQAAPQQFNWLIVGIIVGLVVLGGAIYGVLRMRRRV